MATIGVKIELEGAPKYTADMKNLTAQTKLYQAQVKRLSAEMSTGVSAFTKSITTSKALQQQLQSQQNQAKALAEQIKKVSAEQGEDSNQAIRLKTQYENLQRAIVQTNNELKEQGGIAGAIAAVFDEVGSKISSVGDKMASLGSDLSKNITAPLAAVGAASLKAFDEVDGAYDRVIEKTGATGDALEKMQGIVNNIATEIPTSFEKSAEAVGEVNTRFGATGNQLKELSKAFVEFSELNNTDVSNSIDNVQKALSSYGLGAEAVIPLLDRMNKVGQTTGVNVDKLATGIISNGTAFQELGLSIDEAVTFMGQLEKSGANSETVLNGMRKALKNATSEGKPLDEALSDLQNTILNGTDSMDGLTAAYEIFGKSGDQIYGSIKNGTINFEELAGAMDSAAGSVENTFAATIDPVDELQQHMNELKLVGTDIANTMMPTIEKVMKKFGETVKAVSDAWNSLSTEQQDAIIKFAEVAAVVGPVLGIVGKVISTFGKLLKGIGLVIKFSPTIISAFSSITGFVTTTLIPTISGVAGIIGGIFTSIGAAITGTIIPAIGTAVTAIGGALSAAGAVITGTIIPAIGALVTAIIPFLPIIAGVAAAIAAIVLVVKNWGAITDWISEKWAAFTEYISTGVSTIQEFFSTHFGLFGEMIAARIEIITTLIKAAVEVVKTIFVAFGETLKALFTGDWESIGEIIKAAWIKIATIILSAKAKILQTIAKLIISIGEKFESLASQALTWGSDMIQGFIDGVLAKWESLKETVSRVANTVKDYLGFSEPSKGPMADFNSWPRHMMQNYASGIESMRFLVKNAVADVSADVAVLENPINSEEIYSAVRSGASDANVRLSIGDREFTRALRDMGVVFGG